MAISAKGEPSYRRVPVGAISCHHLQQLRRDEEEEGEPAIAPAWGNKSICYRACDLLK